MFPEMSTNLHELFLGGTLIEELPSSIEYLSNLVILDLGNSMENGLMVWKMSLPSSTQI